jgi:predicted nucleic acid-binding protein
LRLIDTNVVIYAAGKAHPLQDEARKVLDRIAEGSVHANVDVELLQEILHVYAARKERAKDLTPLTICWCFFRTLFR